MFEARLFEFASHVGSEYVKSAPKNVQINEQASKGQLSGGETFPMPDKNRLRAHWAIASVWHAIHGEHILSRNLYGNK